MHDELAHHCAAMRERFSRSGIFTHAKHFVPTESECWCWPGIYLGALHLSGPGVGYHQIARTAVNLHVPKDSEAAQSTK